MNYKDCENAVSPNILLVDDETALLNVMATSLQDSGYECVAVTSAACAYNALEQYDSINVVVSDIRMPGADGLEMLRVIKTRFANRTWLQTLFITGHASLDTALAAMRLEAVDFLSKPVGRADLIAAVKTAEKRAGRYRLMLTALERNKEKLDQLMKETHLFASLLKPDIGPGEDINVRHSENEIKNTGKTQLPTHLPALTKKRILDLLKFRDLRPRFFKERLFSDPAWQMLLDLMENDILGKDVSVSSLYIASGVPISTASRRLDDLEEAGLVTRWDDPKDGRRQYVRVTEKAAELIKNYLTSLDKLLDDASKKA